MQTSLKTTCLVVLVALTVSAVGHGETQPASPVAESGAVDPATAARLTVAQVGAAIAGGASLDDLLRAVAAHNRDPAVTREVLRAGAPIDGRDAHGWTALMYAAAFNWNADVARALLAAGADRGTGERYRAVPSAYARPWSMLGPEQDANVILIPDDLSDFFSHWYLISSLAEVFARVKVGGGEPALFAAAAYNAQPGVLQVLIDAGSDVNAPLEEGVTALMIAAALNPNPEVVESLLAAGADVEARTGAGQTPLMLAARHNINSQILDSLLTSGAKVDTRDDQGRTALVHAVSSSGSDPIEHVRVLLDRGANVHVQAWQDGATPLMYAAEYNPYAIWILRTLVGAGARLDARDYRGWTALMRSAAHGSDTDVIDVLLDLGADISLRSPSGETALDLMEANPDLDGSHVYWRLRELAAGTTLDITAKEVADLTVAQARQAIADAAPLGRLLCEVACYNRNAAVTRALLAGGAPTNYHCARGWTALMRAAALNPNPAVVQALLDAGAELEAPQYHEPTPAGCVHPNPEYREVIDLVSGLSEQYQNTGLRGGEAPLLLAAAYK